MWRCACCGTPLIQQSILRRGRMEDGSSCAQRATGIGYLRGRLTGTMLVGWRGWMLLGLSVASEAFVLGPAMLHASHLSHHSPSGGRQGILRKSNEALSPSSTVIRFSTSEATTAQAMSSLSGGVELEQISGKRLWVQFAAFGFFKRECELELKENGDCIFSKGMVTKGAGAWRVEEEDGQEYIQFSCPLTELYSEVFEIPSSLLFWRVPLRQSEDGTIVLENGQIISERSEWFGLTTTFIDEGTFKARVLAEGEKFPGPLVVDLGEVELPEGLIRRKKKAKKVKEVLGSTGFGKTVSDQIAEPPLPADLASGEMK